jgi:hypothetical protein
MGELEMKMKERKEKKRKEKKRRGRHLRAQISHSRLMTGFGIIGQLARHLR